MKLFISILSVILFGTTGIGLAQQKGGRSSGPPIKVGSKLADVTVFDESGKEFPIREKLNGKHAVLVFGCLT